MAYKYKFGGIRPGSKFGRLTVRGLVKVDKETRVECVCSCGKGATVRPTSLNNGNTRSCGCLTDDQKAWARMFKLGMPVCKRWHKFDEFLKDMGSRPAKGYFLARRDKTKVHSPKNTVWRRRRAIAPAGRPGRMAV